MDIKGLSKGAEQWLKIHAARKPARKCKDCGHLSKGDEYKTLWHDTIGRYVLFAYTMNDSSTAYEAIEKIVGDDIYIHLKHDDKFIGSWGETK